MVPVAPDYDDARRPEHEVPRRPALKLLDLVERKGLKALG